MQREMLRRATPARKMEMVGQMWKTVITLPGSGLRSRYPDESPEQTRRRLVDQVFGEALAEKAYGKREPKE